MWRVVDIEFNATLQLDKLGWRKKVSARSTGFRGLHYAYRQLQKYIGRNYIVDEQEPLHETPTVWLDVMHEDGKRENFAYKGF